jgi:RHS repeat-associated protein
LHIPPNTVLRGEDGKPVTHVSITPIPVDRPPFPLPTNFIVPIYFTVQPGGAYVQTAGTGLNGAWLVYPNYRHASPGQRVQFYQYDPDEKGWYIYGMGTVTTNGAQVQPDVTTRLYAFTGAMFNDGTPAPADGQTPAGPPRKDPIDPSTGLFIMSKTDLYLPDVIPLALTRTYDSGDGYARPFGRSMTHPYAMFLHSEQQYQQVDLILPAGGKIHFVRTSAGTGYADAVFVHQETATTSATPTVFYKSVITWNGNGWNLTLTDGTVYVFGEVAPLQAIRDRYGNTVTIAHASGQTGNVTQVTSPNGRWISFTYNASNQVTQATDNIGRVVAYTYDANGNLSTVTDPASGVTTYTYDASNNLATIKDGRNIVYLTNQYQNGRVSSQTLADPSSTTTLSYTVDGSGNITQTTITDPLGHVEQLTFNANHYIVTDVVALGAPEARTTTTERQAGSNLVTAVTDGLSRRTVYTYDASGHVLTVTQLAGTSDAVTTTFTYEPQFGQLATVTDPMNHTWTRSYDSLGRPTSTMDPLTHQMTIAMSPLGQVTSVTDALQHTSQFGYAGGDLTSITNPVNAVQQRFVDAAGRVIAVTDPLGRQTRVLSDKLNRVTAVTDALGGQTSLAYDPNSNLLTLTDALSHTTAYGYDASDQVATRTDPLQQMASYQYDQNGNLTQTSDRKRQVTNYQYDALDRLTLVTYADMSTIQFVYDAGNRVTQIIDSTAGSIARIYDGLDRLMSETTSEGSVSYTYDSDGRRVTMTVAGQTTLNYVFDNANRLTSITQGALVVAFTSDDANRRKTVTYPNGIIATYGYDEANRLTSLSYSAGQTVLGDLTYTYSVTGNRTSVGGSLARTGIPQPVTGANYDAANRPTPESGVWLTYDANGNLTSDGTTTYTWNARNQLAGLSGGVSASFQYDGVGRRRGKTVSSTTTFLYDGLNLVQELTSGGTPTANLLTGLGIDETFARTDSGGTSVLLRDTLGNTLALADASGVVKTSYTYEPFGATTTSGAASANAQQYTGRENDDTGLEFYRARYYSPRLQRFLSEDPLGPAGGINLYAYVFNNPLGWTDPLGLQLKNLNPDPMLVKLENDSDGFKWAAPAVNGVAGHIDEPIDGVRLPNGDWYKVLNGTTVTVQSDGSVTRTGGPWNWVPDGPDWPGLTDHFPGEKREPGWTDRHSDWKYPPNDPNRDPDRNKDPNRPPKSGRKDPPDVNKG